MDSAASRDEGKTSTICKNLKLFPLTENGGKSNLSQKETGEKIMTLLEAYGEENKGARMPT